MYATPPPDKSAGRPVGAFRPSFRRRTPERYSASFTAVPLALTINIPPPFPTLMVS